MPDTETHQLADSTLVQQAVSGDTQAFGLLYERYAAGIFRFLCAQLPDQFEAEDLTSEVFLRAWRSLPRYRERGNPFSAYLFRIARNAVIDYRRKANERRSSSLQQVSEIPDGRISPVDYVSNLQDHQKLREILDELREPYRIVLVLRLINGFSTSEVAKIMKRSEGAVRVLQHRALNALREKIKRNDV